MRLADGLTRFLACALLALLLAGCGGGAGPEALALLKAGAVEPQTGIWWNAAESGRAFAIERQGTIVTLGAYMYEADGRAVWYVGPLNQQADGAYVGVISRYAGGQTLTGAWQAPTASASVATATFSLSTPTSGTLTFRTSAAEKAVPVQRFAFAGTGAAASGAVFDSGLWWNEAESGRGYFIDVQGTRAAMASYMYDGTGQAVWYLTVADLAGLSFTGSMERYESGQSLLGAYAAPRSTGSAGTVTFRATSASTADLALPGGRTSALRRLVLAATGTPSPGARLEGLYQGTWTNRGDSGPITILALENDQVWLLPGPPRASLGSSVDGLALAAGVSANGNYGSTTLLNYVEPGKPEAGALMASYVAGASAAGQIVIAGETTSFTTAVVATSLYDYGQPATLSTLAGTWQLTVPDGPPGALVVTTAGALSGSVGGCSLSGSAAPRANGRNVFNLSLAASGTGCAFSGTGVAVTQTLATGGSRLWLGAVNAANNDGVGLTGHRTP